MDGTNYSILSLNGLADYFASTIDVENINITGDITIDGNPFSTDYVPEGVINLYYTDLRVKNYVTSALFSNWTADNHLSTLYIDTSLITPLGYRRLLLNSATTSTGHGHVVIGGDPYGGADEHFPSLDFVANGEYGDNRPCMNIYSYAHDDESIHFDSHYSAATGYVADSSNPAMLTHYVDNLLFALDTGKTAGANYTPTTRMTIDPTHVTVRDRLRIGPKQTVVDSPLLELRGAYASIANGPNMNTYTTADMYPLFGMINYTHGNIAFSFDTYYDPIFGWRSSAATGNSLIYMFNGRLKFHYDIGKPAGSISTVLTNVSAEMSLTDGTWQYFKTIDSQYVLESNTQIDGAIHTKGGLGVEKKINAGGIIKTFDVTASTSTTTGSLIAAGGLGVAGAAYFGGAINATNTTDSTSTTTGSVITAGGVGAAKAIWAGGRITAAAAGEALLIDNGYMRIHRTAGEPAIILKQTGVDKAQMRWLSGVSRAAFTDSTGLTEWVGASASGATVAAGAGIDTNAAGALNIGTTTASSVVISKMAGLTTIKSTPTFECPAGTYMYWNAAATNTAPNSPVVYALTESIDPCNHWAPNVGANGRWKYTDPVTRYFLFLVDFDIVSAAGGGAGDVSLRVEQDQTTGTWITVPGAFRIRFMSGGGGGITDHGALTISFGFQTVQNTNFRLYLVAGASATYDVENFQLTVNQMC